MLRRFKYCFERLIQEYIFNLKILIEIEAKNPLKLTEIQKIFDFSDIETTFFR